MGPVARHTAGLDGMRMRRLTPGTVQLVSEQPIGKPTPLLHAQRKSYCRSRACPAALVGSEDLPHGAARMPGDSHGSLFLVFLFARPIRS